MTDFERGYQDMNDELAKLILEHGLDDHLIGVSAMNFAKIKARESSKEYGAGAKACVQSFLASGKNSWLNAVADIFIDEKFKDVASNWELSS